MIDNFLFLVGLIFVLCNFGVWMVGKPSRWSWTRVFLELNVSLAIIIAAASVPWALVFWLGATGFKTVIGVTSVIWTITIFGLANFWTYHK